MISGAAACAGAAVVIIISRISGRARILFISAGPLRCFLGLSGVLRRLRGFLFIIRISGIR